VRSIIGRNAAVGAAALALAAAGTSARATCLWDCNGNDGIVNVSDFLAILADWDGGGPCDFDGEGVGVTDFLALLAHWGPCPPSGACCDPLDGFCAVVTPDDCAADGGAFAGLGTDCTDLDGDRIPDVFELDDCLPAAGCYAGTDPLDPDTDDDGIGDGDEVYGTLDGLDLPGWGLDPCRKDVLVEADWVHHVGQPADRNRPHPNQVARLVAAFAGAPTPNPDGTTGVTLHLDYGQAPYSGGNAVLDPSGDDTVDVDAGFSGGEHFTIKAANFAADRHGYFHYCLMADRYSINGNYVNSSGLAELPGDDFLVAMGQWALGDDNFIGNTIMHELGHNLNLRHGGFENRNFKPNYNSIMNYWYQFCGADADFDVLPDDVTDYSHGLNIDLDETALVEAHGVTGFGPGIDWNVDGDALDTIGRNINCRLTDTYANSDCAVHVQQSTTCTSVGDCDDLSCNALADADDWLLIQLNHLHDSDFAPPEIIHCILNGAVILRPGEQWPCAPR
jgi:hypothetical protein